MPRSDRGNPLFAAMAGDGAMVLCFLLTLGGSMPARADAADGNTLSTLRDTSIEELANVEITSVSKHPEPLADAAAAIYVITGEDIRRSGATSLPEALRLAPNLQVARIDSSTWAISARGFNGNVANKLLVLIDGRSVYTPLYSGVFWDVQVVPLVDIDRIEVISGPGGTLWGANAVNGVINIITKSSKDTQGGVVDVGSGSQERDGTARYGGSIGPGASFRTYATGFTRYSTDSSLDYSRNDGWNHAQAGFRADREAALSQLTLSGDIYQGSIDQSLLANTGDNTVSGGNLLGRWACRYGDSADLQLQGYFDQANRNYSGLFGEHLDTYDLSLQMHDLLGNWNELVWGGGYRLYQDDVSNSSLLAFLPPRLDMTLANVFLQDSMTLSDRLKLTLGSKLEHNNFTGYEAEPDIRLAWKADEHTLLWSAISRAVRTPSRLDTDFFVPNSNPALGPTPYLVTGGPDFQSEVLTAYEIGLRAQPASQFSYSLSAYYNVYDHLRSYSGPLLPGGPALQVVNNIEGDTEGVEAWGSYQLLAWWRLDAGFNAYRQFLHYKPGTTDPAGLAQEGTFPPHQFSLRSSMNLPRALELDIDVYTAASLPFVATPAYVTTDARLGWQASRQLNLAVRGTNLGPPHVEFGNPLLATTSEIRPGIFLDFRWSTP